MSIASWYVIVTKVLQLWRYRRAGKAAWHEFWDATSVTEGPDMLGNGNPFTETAHGCGGPMRHHMAHKGHWHDRLSVSDWVKPSPATIWFV